MNEGSLVRFAMAPGWTADVLKLGWKAGALIASVGVAFGLMTDWIDQRVLGQPQPTRTQLEAESRQQIQLSLALTLVSIDAEIDRRTEITEVSVRTIGSALEEMDFKFPVTEFADVEKAIATELNLPQSDVQKLIRYRIDE